VPFAAPLDDDRRSACEIERLERDRHARTEARPRQVEQIDG